MKRLKLCISILIVIIFLSIGSLFVLKLSNDKLFSLIDKTVSAFENDQDAETCLEELDEYWHKYYKRISYVADYDMLNEISRSVCRLPALLENQPDDFIAELMTVRNCAVLIFNSQFPYVYAIF